MRISDWSSDVCSSDLLDSSVGWNTLLKARPEVATIAETANLDPLTVAADRYATLRKFAPDLLEALQFRAGKGSAKTIAAIEMLRDLNRSGKRDLPADAPMPFRDRKSVGKGKRGYGS